MAETCICGTARKGLRTTIEIIDREAGLHRNLTPRQLSMIAMGGAIGTGLFLGSAISVKLAGPGVIFSYVAAGAIALCLMWALGEMTVAHPVAGSFGVYAEMYVHPWAGFAMRYSYWLAQVIATGSEVVAASIYCKHWFPNVPSWMWIAGFSAALVYVNARSVASFGEFEYWFAMIKVLTIAVFLILGRGVALGLWISAHRDCELYRRMEDFFRTAGKASAWAWRWRSLVFWEWRSWRSLPVKPKDPTTALPRALRWTLGRLGLFYMGGLAIVVGIVPWNEVGLGESPFVRVFEIGRNSRGGRGDEFRGAYGGAFQRQLQFVSDVADAFFAVARRLCSGGFGRLSKRGTAGSGVARLQRGDVGGACSWIIGFSETAYVYMLGSAFLGGIFVWQMIFVTHLVFRRRTAKMGKSADADCSARAVEFAFRTCGAYGGADFDMVGPRICASR